MNYTISLPTIQEHIQSCKKNHNRRVVWSSFIVSDNGTFRRHTRRSQCSVLYSVQQLQFHMMAGTDQVKLMGNERGEMERENNYNKKCVRRESKPTPFKFDRISSSRHYTYYPALTKLCAPYSQDSFLDPTSTIFFKL